jgi:pimeloyl-ACP methyl ester carboxylesterase
MAFFMPKIDIHKGEIYFEWINEKSDSTEVIVFLHEALGSVGQWKDFPQLLCNRTGLSGLVYDRLGYGKSSPDMIQRDSSYLENFAFEEFPFIQEALLKYKKIHLVGHSDGGSIALLIASKYPEYIVSVTTMAAHIFVEDVTLEGIIPAITAFEQGKLDGLKKYHGEKTETLFYNWARTWLSDEYLSWNIESYLPNVLAPSLIIQGEDDQYGTEAQVDGIVNQVRGKSIKNMLNDCGHSPHLESKHEVISLIENFIKNETSS